MNCPMCGCGIDETRMIFKYEAGSELPEQEAMQVNVCRSCGFHSYVMHNVVDAPRKIAITPTLTSPSYLEFSGGEQRVLTVHEGEFIDDRPNGFNIPLPDTWMEAKGDSK